MGWKYLKGVILRAPLCGANKALSKRQDKKGRGSESNVSIGVGCFPLTRFNKLVICQKEGSGQKCQVHRDQNDPICYKLR